MLTNSRSVVSGGCFLAISVTIINTQLHRNETLRCVGVPLAKLDNFLIKAVLVISVGLLCWGLLGLSEYVFPNLSIGLQDSNFPAGLQFIHFFSIILTGSIFVFGYVKRWSHTPHATITMYGVLATICFIETVDFGAFGGGVIGIIFMLMEFTLYVTLSTYLLRSSAVHHHFDNAYHGRDV